MTTRPADDGVRAGQQLDSLRRSNAAAVLAEVRSRGAVSRSEIATSVGLSAAAITKIIAELERAGLIAESQVIETGRGRGRPRRPLGLTRDRHRFVGVHVGLRRVTLGLVDLAGDEVAVLSRRHGSTASGAVLGRVSRLVDALLERAEVSRADVIGYGACSGGWVSQHTGVVRDFPGLGWRDVALGQALVADGLPRPRVESTVRALALAEARAAAATDGARNVLYVFVGNVIGCAHVVHGTIARGRLEAAGFIDHAVSGARAAVPCTCGRHDCVWAVASDAALVLAAQDRGVIPAGAAVEDLVETSTGTGGDARTARRLLDQRAEHMGTLLAALVDVHDPDLVIVGGGQLASSPSQLDLLVAAADSRMGHGREPTPIRAATLLGPSGLVRGAATPAIDAFFADPLGHPA